MLVIGYKILILRESRVEKDGRLPDLPRNHQKTSRHIEPFPSHPNLAIFPRNVPKVR